MKRDFWGIDGEIWGWNRYIITTIFNAQKRVLKNTPCKIGQMFKQKGGGAKAFWTMFKITALFLKDGFPKVIGWAVLVLVYERKVLALITILQILCLTESLFLLS